MASSVSGDFSISGLLGKDSESISYLNFYFNNLLRNSGEGILIVDLKLRIVFWSPLMEKHSGFLQEKVLGKYLFEILPEFNIHQSLLEAALNGDDAVISEIQLNNLSQDSTLLAKGTISPFLKLPKEVAGIIVNLSLIDNPRHVERKNLETLLGDLAYSFHAAIILLEAIRDEKNRIIDFKFIVLNDTASAITGVPHREFQSKSFLQVFPHAYDTFFAKYKNVVESGQPIEFEEYYGSERLSGWFKVIAVKRGDGIILTFENITEQKLNKDKILNYKELVDHAEDLAMMGSWENDLSKREITWSNRMYQIFGLDKSDNLILEDLNQHIVPEDRPHIYEVFNKLVSEAGSIYHHAYRIKTPQGEIRHLEGLVRSIANQKGEVVKLRGFVRDVTQEKEKESILEKILYSSLDGVVGLENVRDENGKVVDFKYILINDKACKLVDRKKEEVIGNTLCNLYPHVVEIGLFEMYSRVAETGKPDVTESYYPFDGLDAWYRIVVASWGRGIVITFSDITDRVEYERKLSLQNDRLTKAQELANLGDFELEFASGKLVWSESLYSIFDINKGSDVDLDIFYAHIHPDHLDLIKLKFNQVILTKADIPFEIKIISGNKVEKFVSGQISPIMDDSENVIKIRGYFQDISGRKEAELQLFKAQASLQEINTKLEEKVSERTKELSFKNDKLQRLNNDLDNFIYTASHDLKAPISNIEALVSSLEEIATNDQDSKMLLDLINVSINRFKTTIRDLTEIAQAAHSDTEDSQSIIMSEILHEIKQDINPLIAKNNAVILDNFICPSIQFSRKNFRSIVYNLVSNAIKYRNPERTPVVEITSSKNDYGFFVLSVKDNGLGIKEEEKYKVFGMFKRLHTHVEGTGVGMYIVKRIVEHEGGRIEIQSKIGEGSTFSVYLPQVTSGRIEERAE
jgi:PAS domain S-box-containing protein